MAWKFRAYGSARSISNSSFRAQLGSSKIKLKVLGSAQLQQIKLRATFARLSSTKNCWLDHPCRIAIMASNVDNMSVFGKSNKNGNLVKTVSQFDYPAKMVQRVFLCIFSRIPLLSSLALKFTACALKILE
jgi:hypothetical protein